MRVDIFTHAILIASCSYFIACDASDTRQCICRSAGERNPEQTVVYAGTPEDQKMFLICLKDGRIFSNSCPGETLWNSRVGGCSGTHMRDSYPECEDGGSSRHNALPKNPNEGKAFPMSPHKGSDYQPHDGLTDLQRCVCREACKNRVVMEDRPLYRCDPHKESNQFLVCVQGKAVVRPCPPNLWWNSERNGCAQTRSCLPLPPACGGKAHTGLPTSHTGLPTSHTGLPTFHNGLPTSHTGLPTSHTGLPTSHTGLPTSHTGLPTSHTGLPTSHNGLPTSHTGLPTSFTGHSTSHMGNSGRPGSYTPFTGYSHAAQSRPSFTQSVAPVQRCVCNEVMVRSGRDMVPRCDPLNDDGYIVCGFGSVERRICPSGQKWNVLKTACDATRKCLPIPARCRFGAHWTTPAPTTTTTTAPPTLAPICSMRYTLFEKKVTWHVARLICEANESELAVILNNETQTLLTKKYGSDAKKSYGGVWIGASDAAEEGKWRWVTGETLEFSNWYPKQPSGYKYQHCLQFNYYKVKGAWDDTRCYYKKNFICQKEECIAATLPLPSPDDPEENDQEE